MTVRQHIDSAQNNQCKPSYSKEEFAQRGDDIYESQIRSQVEVGNHGKIVAIDLETGDFEVDASEIVACNLKSGLFGLAPVMCVDSAGG
jgi:hypothetical protein